jgi:hypothetical protein
MSASSASAVRSMQAIPSPIRLVPGHLLGEPPLRGVPHREDAVGSHGDRAGAVLGAGAGFLAGHSIAVGLTVDEPVLHGIGRWWSRRSGRGEVAGGPGGGNQRG